MEAPAPYDGQFKWAKCDMLATLSYQRMKLPYTGRDPRTGRRKYLQIIVNAEEMKKVHAAVLHGLGLEALQNEK